ncbi:MAG: metalloprotease RseP [Verrucomicrobiaceae bacterium]|nr:metalloprotease RseP [Verrucomicrobiaceae bacterium]
MNIVQMILITALTLGVLVTIHEFGHFWVARRCGVKVLRFCIGFGKPLVRWHDKTGTEFAIAAIPLGGYVKMLDEREGEVPPELLSQSFMRKPVSQRIAIAAAGPVANFLLAIFLYWVMFIVGVGGIAPVIGAVKPGSLAEQAGLVAGQEIVSIDGEETPTIQALHERLLQRIGETGTLRIAAKRPDSEVLHDSTVTLNSWLSGSEEPDLVGGLGIELWRPRGEPIVDQVVPDSPASRAGLQPHDRIESADGVAMPDWQAWLDYVRARPQQTINLAILRDGVRHEIALTPDRKVDEAGKAYGQVGLGGTVKWPDNMLRDFSYSPLAAVIPALNRTWMMSVVSLDSIKKMILGMISPKNLSGPITIAKVATASAKSGWEPYLAFLAFFSVSLGVLNLLPIPVLDGGHILFSLPELFTGKPLPDRIQTIGYQVGLFVVVGVMMLALYNDLLRL